MSNAWQPKNWEEVCKRNAGRRKLHMRKRKERADRIVRLLVAMEVAPELRESAYGWLRITAETMKKSRATVSRDFALARRIYAQFARMFGRTLEPRIDQIKWSWDCSHYGFRARESVQSGHKKPVGHFPFDTRAGVTEEAYCGFSAASWQLRGLNRGSASTSILAALRSLTRLR